MTDELTTPDKDLPADAYGPDLQLLVYHCGERYARSIGEQYDPKRHGGYQHITAAEWRAWGAANAISPCRRRSTRSARRRADEQPARDRQQQQRTSRSGKRTAGGSWSCRMARGGRSRRTRRRGVQLDRMERRTPYYAGGRAAKKCRPGGLGRCLRIYPVTRARTPITWKDLRDLPAVTASVSKVLQIKTGG